MSRSRRLLVLVTALGLPLVALTSPPPAAADQRADVALTSEPQPTAGPPPRRVLTDDVVRPEGSPVSARIRTWPGNRIRYHESIPRKWDWSLGRAINHWNSSGGNMKFVEVGKRRAQLMIRYGPTYGADGVGTLGYQRQNYVHLSTAYKEADELDPETRVWVGRLFTHELGHVLGFGHTGGQCALMYPIYDFGSCPPLPYDRPGYYNCRWIDKELLSRYTRIYGGSPKRPPEHCLIEALPGQLKDVVFGGGDPESSPVRITWTPPSRIRSGTKTRVTVWQGSSCGGQLPDTWERRVLVDTRAGSWTDPSYGQGSWCYRLQIENRYGATRPPHSAAVQRYAPVPVAPQLGPLTWNAADGGYRFTWLRPDKRTGLVVMRDVDDPTSCVTTYDENSGEQVYNVEADTWQVPGYAAAECLAFFAVTSWGTVSPATVVHVEVPAPTVTPTVGPITTDPSDPWAATATVTLAEDYRVGIEVLPGACPSAPPAGSTWWDGYDQGADQWLFYPESPEAGGPNCAMFTAVDPVYSDRHGPVVMRPFTVSPP